MLASKFKRTKIVATIGPASREPLVLEELMLAGVNCFRLNFSHGTHEEHNEVLVNARKLSEKHHRPIAIIADLQGPKIRVGALPSDGLPFVRDTIVRFQYEAEFDKSGVIPVQHDISKYLKKEERIYLRDGIIQVEVQKIEKSLITCKVLVPGLLYSNQGMNLPDSDMGGDILTPKDIADLEFAAGVKCDYLALSFVQTGQDVLNVKARLKKLKSDMLVMSKVETAAAVTNLEEIVIASDALMVARGDLAVETTPESVPGVQRRMIEMSKHHRKTVIVATQMLESMIQSPRPTRAEVSDVATAVLEGTDAVMLSGESAMGLFPVETVKMMKRIIMYAEADEQSLAPFRPVKFSRDRENAISAAAVVLAHHLPAIAIVAETSSGQTARNISALRPEVPIIMVTDHERVYHQMAIVWGGKSYLAKDMAQASESVIAELKAAGNIKKGDPMVLVSGHAPGVIGGTNQVSIRITQ